MGGCGREGFDTAGDDVGFAVDGGFGEEEGLAEKLFDCFGKAVFGLLEPVGYVEGFEGREHLCQEGFFLWRRQRLQIPIMFLRTRASDASSIDPPCLY